MKRDPRDRFRETLREYGWTPVGEYVHRHPATPGGEWQLELNYYDPEGCQYDARLRGAKVTRIVNGESVNIYQFLDVSAKDMLIHRPNGYGGYDRGETPLFLACAAEGDSAVFQKELRKRTPIKDCIEVLVKAPDFAVFLAVERIAKAALAAKKRREEQEEDRRLRARPLPVTVSQQRSREWRNDSDWDQLVQKAYNAVRELERADGKSDFYQLVENVRQATEAIHAVVKPQE